MPIVVLGFSSNFRGDGCLVFALDSTRLHFVVASFVVASNVITIVNVVSDENISRNYVLSECIEVLKRIFLIFVCGHRDWHLNDFQPHTGEISVERQSTRKVRFYLRDK